MKIFLACEYITDRGNFHKINDHYDLKGFEKLDMDAIRAITNDYTKRCNKKYGGNGSVFIINLIKLED